MTHEVFTGVTFNDLDPSGTRISRSSEYSVINSTEIAVNIPHGAQSAYFMNRETTDNIIVYAIKWKVDNNETRKGLFINLNPLDI